MFYKAIFNINLYHAFFLDDGENKFANMIAAEKEKQLETYQIANQLKIVPTQATNHAIINHRMLLKVHDKGFRIVVSTLLKNVSGTAKYSPIIPLSNNLTLTFAIYAVDPYFDNYTQVVSRNESALYLFANKAPATNPGFVNIFTEDGTVDTSFLLSAGSTRNLVYTIAEEDEFLEDKIQQFSVTRIPKTDIEGTEEKKILNNYIQSNKQKGLLGYVRLTIKGDSNHNLLEIDESDANTIKQYVIEPTPEFTLNFKNRKTFWRYVKESDNLILTTGSTKPLTKNGFIEIKKSDFSPQPSEDYKYPNPTVDIVKKEAGKYYSEIFI